MLLPRILYLLNLLPSPALIPPFPDDRCRRLLLDVRFFFFFWCCHQTPDKPPPANQLTLPIVILLWLPFHFSTEPIVAPINQLRIIWPSSITSPDYYNDFPSKLSASKFLWLHSLKGRLAKRSITARAWERRGEQIDKKERQFHQPRNSDDILLTSVDLLDGTREKQRLTESHPIRRLSFVVFRGGPAASGRHSRSDPPGGKSVSPGLWLGERWGGGVVV